MNAYSQDLREMAIDIFNTGNYTKLELSKLLKISYRTIRYWIKQYKESGNCEIAKPIRVGRLRKFDNKELVLKFLEANPDASGKEMQAVLAPHISDVAFYKSLARMGITYKKRGKI